jgi:hypothetical protein
MVDDISLTILLADTLGARRSLNKLMYTNNSRQSLGHPDRQVHKNKGGSRVSWTLIRLRTDAMSHSALNVKAQTSYRSPTAASRWSI